MLNVKTPDPKRFEVAKRTLHIDAFMTHFIKIGGIGIIVTVFSIFLFILIQILPLFKNARVENLQEFSTKLTDAEILGIDEWSELPFTANLNATFSFINLSTGTTEIKQPDLPEDLSFSSLDYDQRKQLIALGTDDGRYAVVHVSYKQQFDDSNGRKISAELETEKLQEIANKGFPITKLDIDESDTKRYVGAIQDINGKPHCFINEFRRKRSLIGKARLKLTNKADLTDKLKGYPINILVNSALDTALIVTREHEIQFFKRTDGEFNERQTIKPFSDLSNQNIASVNFLLGKNSFSVVNEEGINRIFSIYRDEESGHRLYTHTKTLTKLPKPPTYFASSLRNRTFLIGGEDYTSLRFSTTESIRWEKNLPFSAKLGVISAKYDRLALLDTTGNLHIYKLHDPHPESGFKAFFSKIWYEGQNEAQWTWQSTGGSDDFEPKLSLMPLIFGALKGTFYALLLALPISILAATYTSQFLEPKYKKIIKPTMEIMASLPSVVLGFLGALWLAPLIDDQMPSVFLILVGIPTVAIVGGYIISQLPRRFRCLIPDGFEFIIFIPVFCLCGWLLWSAGPSLERWLFVVTDPTTGIKEADFRLWWPEVTGAKFDQRNSLVVGFMMGFAVIPIIFTITEDAISNVPTNLRSASLALGASRWQTTARIVLPTASAGIFSALMIGLGRAIGETMIVVMATGNTPIMEWNIFSGMRTLSANIAVELPEAPQGGTLYRTLFLGAMVLFIMTFIINSTAEVLRARLRERFKTVE